MNNGFIVVLWRFIFFLKRNIPAIGLNYASWGNYIGWIFADLPSILRRVDTDAATGQTLRDLAVAFTAQRPHPDNLADPDIVAGSRSGTGLARKDGKDARSARTRPRGER